MEEIKDAQGKVSLKRKILRIFGINRASVHSSYTQGDQNCVNLSLGYYDTWKTVEVALLEAERRRSEAIMESRRRSFVH